MLAVKLPQTNSEICFRNRISCCTTDLYKFLHSRKKMLPLNCNLSTIPLGVRRETKCSGIINHLGNKDSRRVPFIQQIFTKLWPCARCRLSYNEQNSPGICLLEYLKFFFLSKLEFQEFHKLCITPKFISLLFLLS